MPLKSLPSTDALTTLETELNQLPQFKKIINVRVCQGEQEIRIFLDGYSLPEQQKWLAKLRQGLKEVGLDTSYPIQVYGRIVGNVLPAWHSRLRSSVRPASAQRPPRPSLAEDLEALKRVVGSWITFVKDQFS